MRKQFLPTLLVSAILLLPALAQTDRAIPMATLPPQDPPEAADEASEREVKPDAARFGQTIAGQTSAGQTGAGEAGAGETGAGETGADDPQSQVPGPLPPIIGTTQLLHSLAQLDRPLSPEEITAYGAALQSLMPMTPQMIRDFRKRLDENQKAASEPPSGKQPHLISDAIRLSLKPGQALSSIATAADRASVISFYDRTGQAWPVASFVVGRADMFQVYALQEGSNKLAITALQPHGSSNLIVSLVEESRPIVFHLQTAQPTVVERRDITVDAYGPNAVRNPTTVAVQAAASNPIMLAFVEGAALPQGAVRLPSTDPDIDAWAYGGAYYIRSPHTLISPSWLSVLSGPGDIHAYRINKTPIVLMSRNGQIVRVRVGN
ncbi:DotH/IcmK family type IV secretion protein [Ochrobactrum sp. AN78]|uniref:DotH/IcmK family type IV secretion protein n=1 Tax=Ochrobactrum sp. AN78 TaxID=3039853 RepID=UPI002989F883|nr:DotH/IcmK family type IV secretion protein [Ochrobactrum sp. AN78]MDH7792548.1 intracellular multiplication protein IcmK [Ochrobactrum sp. AN78]